LTAMIVKCTDNWSCHDLLTAVVTTFQYCYARLLSFLCHHCRAECHNPYIIPAGGFSAVGSWGQIDLWQEMIEQVLCAWSGLYTTKMTIQLVKHIVISYSMELQMNFKSKGTLESVTLSFVSTEVLGLISFPCRVVLKSWVSL